MKSVLRVVSEPTRVELEDDDRFDYQGLDDFPVRWRHVSDETWSIELRAREVGEWHDVARRVFTELKGT